jgi:hypothetical protein
MVGNKTIFDGFVKYFLKLTDMPGHDGQKRSPPEAGFLGQYICHPDYFSGPQLITHCSQLHGAGPFL